MDEYSKVTDSWFQFNLNNVCFWSLKLMKKMLDLSGPFSEKLNTFVTVVYIISAREKKGKPA